MRRFAPYLIAVPMLCACQMESVPTSLGRSAAQDLPSDPVTAVVGSSFQSTITDYARYWPGTDGIGINDAGDITAQITPPLGPAFNRAALVRAGTLQFIDIGTLGGASSRPSAISNTQGIVGTADLLGNQATAFIWHQATGMRDLGSLGGTSSLAYDANARDEVVGISENSAGDFRAFLWTATSGMLDLGTLGGSTATAEGINARGVVVGSSRLADGRLHAFLWTRSSGMIDLIPEASYAVAHDVSDEGVVVGETNGGAGHQFVAFRWTARDRLQRLGTLGGSNSRAWAVNNAGAIVGESDTRAGGHNAFFWTQAIGMKSLGALFSAASSAAFDINQRNEIAGWSQSQNPEVLRTVVKWTLTPAR